MRIFLDVVPTLTEIPIVSKDSTNSLVGKIIGLIAGKFGDSAVWTKWLNQLRSAVNQQTQISPSSTSKNITTDDLLTIILANGGPTFTLPTKSTKGDSYYFFNYDNNTTTILGNVNGNPSGYLLVNKYQYVQLTSVDGSNWIVTVNN